MLSLRPTGLMVAAALLVAPATTTGSHQPSDPFHDQEVILHPPRPGDRAIGYRIRSVDIAVRVEVDSPVRHTTLRSQWRIRNGSSLRSGALFLSRSSRHRSGHGRLEWRTGGRTRGTIALQGEPPCVVDEPLGDGYANTQIRLAVRKGRATFQLMGPGVSTQRSCPDRGIGDVYGATRRRLRSRISLRELTGKRPRLRTTGSVRFRSGEDTGTVRWTVRVDLTKTADGRA